jgi:hypothetical protein
VVYIREAHPTDGWQLASNLAEGVIYRQAQSTDERAQVAEACAVRLKFTIPTLIDGIDNAVDLAFNAWPERLYVLDTQGIVIYQGGKGPYGFDPDELNVFLQAHLPDSSASG